MKTKQMQSKIHLFFILSIFIFSCSENKTPEKKEEKKNKSEQTEIPKIELADGEYFYQGMINHKYAFHMMMEVKDNSINGMYYYDSKKLEITMNGNFIDNQLELDEMYKEKITGHFKSNTFTIDSISGKWKSPKGVEMDFALFNSSKEEYYSSMKEPEQNWTKIDFENWLTKFPKLNLPINGLEADGEDLGEDHSIEDKFVLLFLNSAWETEDFIRESYSYTATYSTENYIAVLYTEHYIPGAFGINNHSLFMKTFTREGKLIDELFLGCFCFDNNRYDYYHTMEKFDFTENKIFVTGEEIYASHEWAEEENMPVFNETTPIKREIRISTEGEFEY